MQTFSIKFKGSVLHYKQIILLLGSKSGYGKQVEIVMALFKNIRSYWMHQEKILKHISWKTDRSISLHTA